MWTKERPAKTGLYWYRKSQSDTALVVFYDVELRALVYPGIELFWGDDYRAKITGEFWSERLEAPQ